MQQQQYFRHAPTHGYMQQMPPPTLTREDFHLQSCDNAGDVVDAAHILFELSKSGAHWLGCAMRKDSCSTDATRSPSPEAALHYYEEIMPLESDEKKRSGLKKASKLKKKKQDGEKVSRPVNCFMLFAKDLRPIVRKELQIKTQQQKVDNRLVSTILGERWSQLAQEEKDKYLKSANEQAVQHKEKHPNYRFTRQKSTKKRALSSSSSV